MFFARSMSGVRPRGSVGAAWQGRKEAKTGGKDETALPKEEPKADTVGDTALTVDCVIRTQNSCELEGKKIFKGSGGSVYETANKDAGSVDAVESLQDKGGR